MANRTKKNEPRTLKKEAALANAEALMRQAEEELPDKGYQRNEELAKREDSLQERAARQAEQIDMEAFDPRVMETINEIAEPIFRGLLDVPNRVDGKQYCWVRDAHDDTAITEKQIDGWEIVCGDMPECAERKDALGRRKIGDVILMRIDTDRYEKLQRRQLMRTRAMREGVNAVLLDLAHRYRDRGVSIRAEDGRIGPEGRVDRSRASIRRAAAEQIAGQKFDDMVRAGQVPGVPAPGKSS